MIIGVPAEIKNREFRVGLTEAGVRQMTERGHEVLIQKGAGLGSFISDENYLNSGAKIINTAKEVYKSSEMIVKVKEPLLEEYELFQERQILYTYLHLAAADKELTQMLCQKKIKSIAYETIEGPQGGLPLLTPMSEVAGRMATQMGAIYLQKNFGGKGVLLSGGTGVSRAHVCILGGGCVGFNAAKIAVGLGARVTILDVNLTRLEYLDNIFKGLVQTLHSNSYNIEKTVLSADLIVGAVLIAGAKAPQLVSSQLIHKMDKGSVVVDVAVDQGGCVETCRPTSHENPIYEVDGVIHYCVSNMPGVVARTSTYALTNATFQYGCLIACQGLEKALKISPLLKSGINTYEGHITYSPVSEALDLPYKDLNQLL